MESTVSSNLSEFIGNVRNRYTLRLGVVEIVEAATSIGLHILRERLIEEAEGYVQVSGKLAERGVLSRDAGGG
ncbi:hypothetical protein [Infirmifilum sp. SLHALR2]|nr:MAG: hypothetical protein B7L53_01800 [Thermofilum sp. NZ13]